MVFNYNKGGISQEMKDEELIQQLSDAIVMCSDEFDNINHYLVDYLKSNHVDSNIQTVLNHFYSVIEITDGIYSLTYDKNIGSINILCRIHYEVSIQFLALISGDIEKNILSYDYHQMLETYETNEFLLNNFDGYSSEGQDDFKHLLEKEKYKKIRAEIESLKGKNKRMTTKWYIVTAGNPKSFKQLIKNYFGADNEDHLYKYYGFLSKYVHNSNVGRFVRTDNTLANIRNNNLDNTSLYLTSFLTLSALLKFIHFCMEQFDYTPYKYHDVSPEEVFIGMTEKK